MNKSEFSKLSIEKQVEYINDNIKNYGSATKVIEAIGYNESTVRKKLNKHGYHMNNDKTAYVLDNKSETLVINIDKSNNKDETKVIPNGINKTELQVIDKNNNLTAEKINTFTKEIQKFNSLKDEMIEMLDWYRVQKKNENIIDVSDQQITIDTEKISKDEAKTKGIKVYLGIYDEFREFAKKHNQYKLQDLTAMAMIEYMDKYKKE
jgi:hypothetical protein